MAHPRTAIVALFAERLAALPSLPSVFSHTAEKPPIEKMPAVSMDLGDEEIVGAASVADGSLLPTVRKLRVRVVCWAQTLDRANDLAAEVEASAPYEAGVGTVLAGSNFAADLDGDRPVFSVRVNFDVTYESQTGSA